MPAFNREFAVKPAVEGSAFVPYSGDGLEEILCEQFDRTVNKDNCVAFDRKKLQIPAHSCRRHYVKARVRVHRYTDGQLAVFYGPRKLASYTAQGLPCERLPQRVRKEMPDRPPSSGGRLPCAEGVGSP